MGANCCNHDSAPRHDDGRYRRILWIALLVNLAMFLVEIGAGLKAGSVSLLADSLDFLGDAANYGISLWVLGMALAWRARAAQLGVIYRAVVPAQRRLNHAAFIRKQLLMPQLRGNLQKYLNCFGFRHLILSFSCGVRNVRTHSLTSAVNR